MEKKLKLIEELSLTQVEELLDRNQLDEFIEFCRERHIDGRKLLNVTEGIVKLWRPKINANKLIIFIEELKLNPEKFAVDPEKGTDETNFEKLNFVQVDKVENVIKNNVNLVTEVVEHEVKVEFIKEDVTIESQYQTVRKTKDNNMAHFSNVEEIIKRIVPVKSFLYRNQENKQTPSYLPMEANTNKRKKLFRLSGYDYPIFDWKRFSKPDNDRGYYPMKRNSRFFTQKIKSPESKRKYNSVSTAEELKYSDDHFYEDLCYSDIDKNINRSSVPANQAKPYRVKIQELFQSLKLPFFKRFENVVEDNTEGMRDKAVVVDKEPVYENTDSASSMYDSVHVHPDKDSTSNIPVEDYLEPMQVSRDYCDVTARTRDDSILGYIMNMLEHRFGIKRETNEHDDNSDTDSHKTIERTDEKRWPEQHNTKTNMAERPLPVPIENEPYYMNIERSEAENLLKGHPNGTFVLRPSSQPNHAYTLTVSCNNAVHNVGIRKRPDGRYALGFARRGERCFTDVTSLLRHHRKRRLLLVADGAVIGATTLTDTPQYYQSPCSLPVM